MFLRTALIGQEDAQKEAGEDARKDNHDIRIWICNLKRNTQRKIWIYNLKRKVLKESLTDTNIENVRTKDLGAVPWTALEAVLEVALGNVLEAALGNVLEAALGNVMMKDIAGVQNTRRSQNGQGEERLNAVDTADN